MLTADTQAQLEHATLARSLVNKAEQERQSAAARHATALSEAVAEVKRDSEAAQAKAEAQYAKALDAERLARCTAKGRCEQTGGEITRASNQSWQQRYTQLQDRIAQLEFQNRQLRQLSKVLCVYAERNIALPYGY